MKIWLMRAMLVFYAFSISATLVACMGGEGGGGGSGCGGGEKSHTVCGEGTKKVKSGENTYKCVPNQ